MLYSRIDSPRFRFFQRKEEEEEEEEDLESRAHLGFQSLFGYIKHVTRGTTTRHGGYSATYAYVRESNIVVCIYIYIGRGGRIEAEGSAWKREAEEEEEGWKRDSPATACGDASAPHEC